MTKFKEDKLQIRQGTYITNASPGRVIIGIAGMDIEPGETFTIDMTKGSNQLVWPDDGKEVLITLKKEEGEMTWPTTLSTV